MGSISPLLTLAIVVGALVVLGRAQRIYEQRRAAASGWTLAPRKGISASDDPPAAYQKLVRSLQIWGAVWVVFGAWDLVSSKFVDPWSYMLIIVGALTFFFIDDPAMYILYLMGFVWVACRNLINGRLLWAAIGMIFPLYLGWVYSSFQRVVGPMIRAEAEPPPLVPNPDDALQPKAIFSGRARRYFPWLALWLGALAIGGYALTYGVYMLAAQPESLTPVFDSVLTVTLYAALLSAGFSVAALLAKYEARGASVVGLSTAALRMLLYALVVLPKLFQRGTGPVV